VGGGRRCGVRVGSVDWEGAVGGWGGRDRGWGLGRFGFCEGASFNSYFPFVSLPPFIVPIFILVVYFVELSQYIFFLSFFTFYVF